MSADFLFSFGLTEWPDLDNVNFQWLLLLDTWTPDAGLQYVADVSADEAVDASYSRVVLSGASVSWGGASSIYDADDPNFGALVGGESLAWLVLFRQVTNDADSILMAAYRIAKVTDGSNVTVVMDSAGIHEHATE